MSTNYKPLFRNAVGHTQNFGAEETLSWNFTSATGNPMELVVGGSTYFTFERDGSFTIESDITWNADTGGSVGEQYDYRPDTVNVATTLAVGAASGTGDGAKLQLNTLTLGHADVDKYIDAEQGLGNTPFLRYNAVNTRWEFSDDGISATAFSAGFGTTTWDALYAADKTLIVDSTVLTFNQTATTGVAFAVVRNLSNTSTDAPVMLLEQQHASDDQPALAIAQVATAASALDIYEGTQAAGTIRYGFGATGKLTVTTNATLADSAIHIVQNDADQPFLTAEGTAGAGSSVSISTDNGATADMIQVTVDSGTPATRWIPAYSSTTLPGTVSWDGIYLLDKHLAINSTALQFEQTATTGRGFEVFRNLTSTSTDAPVVVLEQQHASDDQPPLAIGQLASAADVLRLYDGSITSGTMRFQFQPQGRLNIVTNAALASEALRIEQNDDDVAFMEFKGTAAAGAGNNISTDNSPTADMLRVTVDDGGGADIRWIPAYNSSTLPATATWDEIYAGDKTLDIDSTVLTFDQSSTTGIGFTVSRTLAAASTDSPIMKVVQGSNTDDQPGLQTVGGIANVVLAAGVPVAESIATSGGMTTGTNNVMIGHRSTVVTHATDAVGSIARAYDAQLDNAAGGSAVTVGFWVDSGFTDGIFSQSPVSIVTAAGLTALSVSPGSPTTATTFVDLTASSGGLTNLNMTGLNIDLTGHAADTGTTSIYGINLNFTDAGTSASRGVNIPAGWDYGLYVASPSYLGSTTFAGSAGFLDNFAASFGNTPDATIAYRTTQSPDALVMGLGADSRSLIVCEQTDAGVDHAHPLQTNPTIFIQSSDATDVGEFLGLSYLGLQAGAMATDKATFDVTIAGVDAYASAVTNLDGGDIILVAGSKVGAGADGIVQIQSATTVTQNTTGTVLSVTQSNASGSIVSLVGTLGTRLTVTDPGKFTFTAATTDDAVIINQASTGAILQLQDNTTPRLDILRTGAISHTPAAPTASFDAHSIALSSGGADGTSATLKALEIATAGHASDTNALPIIGLELDHTAGGTPGTDEISTAVLVQPGYQRGLWMDTVPGAADASALVCNDGTGALLYLGDGTIAGIGSTTVNRILVGVNGSTTISADTTGTAVSLVQNDTGGGTAGILKLSDAASSVTRFEILQNGRTTLQGDVDDAALKIGQTYVSVGGNILECADGVLSGTHTTRFQVHKTGVTQINTTTDLATQALIIIQNDADQGFIYFDGTFSNPSAGSMPADNITAIDGGGAVVGPHAYTGSGTETFWSWEGMVRVRTDESGGTSDVWLAYYKPGTA